MKKLSLKWKLFLIACYLQFIVFGIFIFLMTISVFTDRYITQTDMITYYIMAGSFLLICLNNFFNIYVVHRYFPETPVPAKLKVFMKIIGIINIIIWAGLLLLGIFGFTESLNESRELRNTIIIFLSLYFFLWATGILTLIMQFRLFGFLNRGQKSKMDLLIDSIGNQ